MPRQEYIRKLIDDHTRRLQKLKERQALEGISVDPKVSIEIEDLETKIQNLQRELEALVDSGVGEEPPGAMPGFAKDPSQQRVIITLIGEFTSLSDDRRSAAIDALAAMLRIPPQAIEVYRVYEGSIVFDLGIPSDAVQRLRFLLQSNNAQLHLLKVEKVILEREPGKTEEWVVKEGRFALVSPTPLAQIALFAFRIGPTWVRRFIVNNLARHNRAVADTIIPLAIRDENLSVRLAALALVGHYRRLQDLDVLAIALRDPHATVRATAAHLLGQSRSARAGNYLQPALSDPSPVVRAAAVQSIGLIRIGESSPALEKALADEDLLVRGNAAWALGRLGHAEALIPLQVMAARDPIYKNRELAQQASVKIRRHIAPEPEKRRLLRAELTGYLLDQNRPLTERQRVKNALIRLGGEALISLFDQALEKTNDVKIHLDIVEILVTLTPGKQLQNVLIGCLHHISSPVRRLAMTALGDIGDREAIFFLGEVAREGRQPNQLLNLEDTRLANEAIEKIEKRTS